MKRNHRQSGVVLLIVLFFSLMLSASISTFIKRATVDSILSRNRDLVARAETLARGGVEIGKGLLIRDKVLDATRGGERLDTNRDNWAQARHVVLPDHVGGTLRLRIEDDGAKLNLNSLFPADEASSLPSESEAFLIGFFELMIDELPIEIRALYDPRELTENLVDFVDVDETRISGGPEDDHYQKQSPPYRAVNRPLMSVEEIALVEGFDSELVDVIRPYVTVFPLVGGGGVNPNTAPPHTLRLIFYNDGVGHRFIQEDDLLRILDAREDRVFCAVPGADEKCADITEYLPNSESIHPPLSYTSETFVIRSEARIANVTRTVEAIVDRREIAEPLLLSWKVW